MLNKIIILMLVWTLIGLKKQIHTTIDCEIQSSKYFYYVMSTNKENNVTWSFLANFKEFNDTILDCNQTYNITEYVAIWPERPLIIDQNIQLKKIFPQNQIDSITSLNFVSVKGIDLNSKSSILTSNQNFKQMTVLKICFSILDFYSNSILIDSNQCDLTTYNNSTIFVQNFISFVLQHVKYPEKWCPYFFRNFDLTYLALLDIKNSFLIKNRLNFFMLNSNIYLKNLKVLLFGITYDSLDRSNLSPDLFRKVKQLGITGVLNGIESNLFKSFVDLRVINIAVSNLREFFHTGNQWMSYLNLNASNNNNNKSFMNIAIRLEFRHLTQIVSFDSFYHYPNEDLCLFKDFPHERYVYPLLVPGKRIECTCTIYWLQLNTYKYEKELNVIPEYNLNYKDELFKNVFLFCNTSFDSSECQFGKKFKMCSNSEDIRIQFSHQLSFDNDSDILYMIKFVEFILLVILMPMLCFIGIINNGLTILVIRNRNMKKEFQESMYKHIIINAGFNIVYCLIMGLKLINTCIFYGPSVFCSNVYQEIWAQQFKIILIHFLGNVTKMCSNVSYFFFSITRLLLLTKHKTGVVINMRNKNTLIYIYIIILVLINCILSLFKLFQYRTNTFYDFSSSFVKEFPYELRDEEYCKNVYNLHECQLFNVFKIANRSLNDLLFVLLNILIDLTLMVKFKKLMDGKLSQINDLAQRTLIEKSKKNLNRMILFNGFIYIVSHLPAFTITLLLVIYSKKIANFCFNKFSCDLLNEEADVFSLISIVCQFYVFKNFDKHFKRSFNEFKLHFRSFLCRLIFKQTFSHREVSIEMGNLNNNNI